MNQYKKIFLYMCKTKNLDVNNKVYSFEKNNSISSIYNNN